MASAGGAALRGLEAVLDAGSAARGWGADQCWTLARMAEVGRSRFGLGGKLASLCMLLYRTGWSVQVAARRAAGRERRRSPSGEKRPGRWQRTGGRPGRAG